MSASYSHRTSRLDNGLTIVTVAITQTLPNIYTSETVILVDPQKVPESYVKATVTGDVRRRGGEHSFSLQ